MASLGSLFCLFTPSTHPKKSQLRWPWSWVLTHSKETPQPATPGVQGGRPALTVRACSARLGSSSFSTPVSAAEPQSERSSVRKGPLHFLPPAAAACPEPPHPLVPGSPLRTGRGRRGGGQRPWLESGRRRDLGDAAQGGACSEM